MVLEPGVYILKYQKNIGSCFALLEVINEKEKRLYVLPYNFVKLLPLLKNICKKSDLNQYLSTLPNEYIDSVKAFLIKNKYEFDIPDKHRNELPKLRDKDQLKTVPEKNDLRKIPIHILSNVLNEITNEKQTRLRVNNKIIKINYDTISNPKNPLLYKYNDPTNSSKSPITPKMLDSLFKEHVTNNTKNEKEEEKKVEIEEVQKQQKDDISILEEFLILLRERRFQEVIKMLDDYIKRKDFLLYLLKFINDSIKRFKIIDIPDNFKKRLASLQNIN